MSTITESAVSRHLSALTDAGYTREYIDTLANVPPGTAGTDPASMRLSHARRILTVPAPVPARELLGRLIAAGYTISWLASRISHADGGSSFLAGHRLSLLAREDMPAPTTLVTALHRLARDLGDKVATPRPGLPARSIVNARQWGTDNGFYPPAMYDEDGSTPTRELWLVKDELRAENKLSTLRTLLTARRDGVPLTDTAPLGANAETWERQGDLLIRRVMCGNVHPGGAARRDYLLSLLAAYGEGRLDATPMGLALALGLIHPGVVKRKHPAHKEAVELAHLNPLVAVPVTEAVSAA